MVEFGLNDVMSKLRQKLYDLKCKSRVSSGADPDRWNRCACIGQMKYCAVIYSIIRIA